MLNQIKKLKSFV